MTSLAEGDESLRHDRAGHDLHGLHGLPALASQRARASRRSGSDKTSDVVPWGSKTLAIAVSANLDVQDYGGQCHSFFPLEITVSYRSSRPQRALPPRGEGGRTHGRISRDGSGVGEFAGAVGGTGRIAVDSDGVAAAGFDVAVFTGLGQSDGEDEKPEEGLRKHVTE